MRESFGGAFMIKLVLVFIVVYISFMAVAVNYAKAFRVKNRIINILEQQKYNGSSTDASVLDSVATYLSGVGYNYSRVAIGGNYCADEQFVAPGANGGGGYCLQKVESATTGDYYYKVTTYIVVDFPFFNIHMVLPISGETRVIHG